DSRTLPSFTRPSYRLASYSGMPMPTRAPTRPPTAPPTPRPASAPMIGPAAMNGPTPGIASAPMPPNKPSRAPERPAGGDARRRTFRRLRLLLVREILRALVVGHEHRDVSVREA